MTNQISKVNFVKLDSSFNFRIGKFWLHLTYPSIRNREFGFQIIADTALRIDTYKHVYGLCILGLGFALVKAKKEI